MKTVQLFVLLISITLPLAVFGRKKQVEIEVIKTTKVKIIWKENGELTTKNILRERQLSQYDDGGYFDCRGWSLTNSHRDFCDENKIRDFIWRHWTEKKRAYIRVTYDSVDATSTSHIFIEPNKKDEWTVAWRIVRHINEVDDVLGIISVEQVKNKPKNGNWALVFKNKSGRILEKLPDFYE